MERESMSDSYKNKHKNNPFLEYMMKAISVTKITKVLGILVCISLVIYLVFLSDSGEVLSQQEVMLKDLLTVVFTFLSSWLLADWYSRKSNTEKVDTIAERSTEKMVLLSVQLIGVKNYLEDTKLEAEKESNATEALSTYRHRTQAAAILITSLANSNETFRGDWLGVVSDDMRKLMEEKHNSLKKFIQDEMSPLQRSFEERTDENP